MYKQVFEIDASDSKFETTKFTEDRYISRAHLKIGHIIGKGNLIPLMSAQYTYLLIINIFFYK
jgi:hypothetical protein